VRGVLACLLVARIAGADTPKPVRHASTPRPRATDSDDAKARAALAVIDGTARVDEPRKPDPLARKPDPGARTDRTRADEDRSDARAIVRGLKPWRATILDREYSASSRGSLDGARGSLDSASRGGLDDAEQLAPGDGYHIRRPTRAYGAPCVVEYLQGAVAEVRALYPDVPTLAIGDLSAEHGGALAGHVSHRGGRDVDVGFYFHHAARDFEDAGKDLDLEATWALLAAFARTADRDDGVQIIFLDYAVQKRLYTFAKARGTPDDELAFLFQYPAGKGAQTGLVRHWPNHANHFHVRFKR